MSTGTQIIIALSCIAVGSAVAEKILEACGKQNIAEFLRICAVSLGATTAIGIFIKFITALKGLG